MHQPSLPPAITPTVIQMTSVSAWAPVIGAPGFFSSLRTNHQPISSIAM